MAVLLLAQAAKEIRADDDEEQIRKPDEQLGMDLGIGPHGVGDDDEEKLKDRHDQACGKADRGLAPVGCDA